MTTTYFLNLVAGNLFGAKKDPAIPVAYYIGLSSTEPNIGGSNVTEPSSSGTGYARVQITELNEPADGKVTNKNIISFPSSTQAWGTMTHYVIYDAASEGNLLMYGNLSVSRNIESDTVLSISAGELELTVANPS